MIELLKKNTKSSEGSIKFSFFVSISNILMNLAAALITGSAVLLAKMLQALFDGISSALLYFGYRHSRRRPNSKHPFGYGREVFFWVLISSVIIGGLTGTLSIMNGVNQLKNSQQLEATYIVVMVLIVGSLLNSYSVKSSLKKLIPKRNSIAYLKRLLGSSFVEAKLSIMVNSLNSISGAIALMAIVAYIVTTNARYDGYGAIGIGIITLVGAITMIIDLYGLIIGKSANQETIELLKSKTQEIEGVASVKNVRAVLIGSGLLLVIINVVFDHSLDTLQIEHRSTKIRKRMRDEVPGVRKVVVETDKTK